MEQDTQSGAKVGVTSKTNKAARSGDSCGTHAVLMATTPWDAASVRQIVLMECQTLEQAALRSHTPEEQELYSSVHQDSNKMDCCAIQHANLDIRELDLYAGERVLLA